MEKHQHAWVAVEAVNSGHFARSCRLAVGFPHIPPTLFFGVRGLPTREVGSRELLSGG